MLQSVQSTFKSHTNIIVDSLHFITQNILYKILLIVTTAKKKCSETSVNDRHLDVIAALSICEKALYGPATRQRIYIARLALGASDPGKTFDTESLNNLEKHLKELENILRIFERIEELCSTTFLYWQSSIIQLHFKIIYENSMSMEQFQV